MPIGVELVGPILRDFVAIEAPSQNEETKGWGLVINQRLWLGLSVWGERTKASQT